MTRARTESVRISSRLLLLPAIALLAAAAPDDGQGVLHATDFGARCDGVAADGAAISRAIEAAAARPTGGVVELPAGRCRIDQAQAVVRLRSRVVLRGQGMGVSVLVGDDTARGADSPAVTNAPHGQAMPPVDRVTLRDLTVEGMRRSAGGTLGQPLIYLSHATDLLITDVEVRDGRRTGIGVYDSASVVIRDSRVARVSGDGIDCWDTPDCLITGNHISETGDDSIAAHTGDDRTAPIRSGLIITDNLIEQSDGIKVLGPKSVIISNNVLRRMLGYGIIAAADRGLQGDTPNFGLRITDNVITDVFRRGDDSDGSNREQHYILVGGLRRTGAAASLGAGTGDFYGNAHLVRGAPPSSPVGARLVVVSGNSLLRTLPAVRRFGDWGYGTLEVGTVHAWDGAVTEEMLATPGIDIAAGLQDSLITDNLIAIPGTPHAVGVSLTSLGGPRVGLADADLDGLTIARNRIVGFAAAGVFFPPGEPATRQRIEVADNDIDGGDTWTHLDGVVGVSAPGIGGLVLERNRFRNVSRAVLPGADVLAIGNLVFAGPVAVAAEHGYDPRRAGVGELPSGPGWRVVPDGTPFTGTR